MTFAPADLAIPAYGMATLADLSTSLLDVICGSDNEAPLQLPSARRWVLLVIDGLGAQALARHRDIAPLLASLPNHALRCGLPATTVTSLTSVATAAAPAAHGMLGYTIGAGASTSAFNALRWTWCDGDPSRPTPDPAVFQLQPTIFERARHSGARITVVNDPAYRTTQFTVATLRGAEFVAAQGLEKTISATIDEVRAARSAMVYAYHPGLDAATHEHGVGSAPWCNELVRINSAVERLLNNLPPETGVAITADHGAVNTTPADHIDFDTTPALRQGVAYISGEARLRYVHAKPGAAGDVEASWRDLLGTNAHVVSAAKAISEGWFGPNMTSTTASRIGDVVAFTRRTSVIVQAKTDPDQALMIGHHGSATEAEQLVPCLVTTT